MKILQKLLTILGVFWVQMGTLYYVAQNNKDSSGDVKTEAVLPTVKGGVVALMDALDCSNDTYYQSVEFKSASIAAFSEEGILSRTQDCLRYFEEMPSHGFHPLTPEESDFPLAFTYNIKTDPGVFEIFLSQYFRPTDSYCIHIDAKADDKVNVAVKQIVNCYNALFPDTHIFVAEKSVAVFTEKGGSMMEADWICYKELIKRSGSWKMVANVAGTEMPMESIQEFRNKLKKAGGNVMAMRMTNSFTYRQDVRYKFEG